MRSSTTVAADSNDLHRQIAVAWAKSDARTGGSLSLVSHLSDTAEVARRYWVDHLAAASRSVVEYSLISSGIEPQRAADVAHQLAVLLAGIHDAGKLSAAFSKKVPELRRRMESAGFIFPALSRSEQQLQPHALISQAHFTSWLRRRYDLTTTLAADTLAIVVGGHHGVFPSSMSVQACRLGIDAHGDDVWFRARDALIERMFVRSGISDSDLEQLCHVGINQASQVVLTGFVIVCDWLASNADFFPLGDAGHSARDRADDALTRIELSKPWQPTLPPSNDFFQTRFSLPAGGSPRPIQLQAMTTARQLLGPELVLIEAPTGEGKTEAAYAAAEILAARFGAGGVLTALPTQATSDAMFTRKLTWLRNALPDSADASISLSHGRAQFNETFNELKMSGISNVYDDPTGEPSPHAIRAHWWLSGRKKAALANFVVGTIDQVLLAALTSRHVVLRHLGMSGQIVILDEVHAADSYMQVYLDRALEWLGALGVPVIALSATLPPARRAGMLTSYQRGRGDSKSTRAKTSALAEAAVGYPLISTSQPGAQPVTVTGSGRECSSIVELLEESPAALLSRILELCAEGGCVAVIHNTVGRAQQTYRALKPTLGKDVVLLHSRFIAQDRLRLERDLVQRLGPNAIDARPKRLVVVATQVIEQSLDLDFDVMISDLAPMDSLIQRLGRVHRHDRPTDSRPPALRRARLIITGFDRTESDTPRLETGSAHIYGESSLLRTLAVLHSHLAAHPTITSPDDVSGLVRATYDPALASPAGWESDWTKAEAEAQARLVDQQHRAASGSVDRPARSNTPLLDWSAFLSDAKDETTASRAVRDSTNSFEVLVVRRDEDGTVRSLSWISDHPDEPVDLGTEIAPGLAKAIARCTLRLPAWLSQPGLGDRVIDELEADGFDTWQKSPWLKGELPLVLEPDLTRAVAGLVLRYDRELGLMVEKGQEE